MGGNIFGNTQKKFFWGGKNLFFWKKNWKKFLEKNLEKFFFFFYFFNIIVPYFDSNRFFQAKSLSYNIKLLLGLLLVQFQKIWWNRFYANSKKLWFWAKMAIFRHIWPKSAKMRNFIKNRAVLFFTLIVPQLHAKFQKNRWSGFRDQFVTN